MDEQKDLAEALRMRLERALQDMLNHLELNTDLIVEIIELAQNLALPETEEKAQEIIRHKRLYVMNEIPHKISPISMLETINTLLQELSDLRADLAHSMDDLLKGAEEGRGYLAHQIAVIERSITSLAQKVESVAQQHEDKMQAQIDQDKHPVGKHTASILAELDKQRTHCSNR